MLLTGVKTMKRMFQQIGQMKFGLVVFYDILNIMGYLMPKPVNL